MLPVVVTRALAPAWGPPPPRPRPLPRVTGCCHAYVCAIAAAAAGPSDPSGGWGSARVHVAGRARHVLHQHGDSVGGGTGGAPEGYLPPPLLPVSPFTQTYTSCGFHRSRVAIKKSVT